MDAEVYLLALKSAQRELAEKRADCRKVSDEVERLERVVMALEGMDKGAELSLGCAENA